MGKEEEMVHAGFKLPKSMLPRLDRLAELLNRNQPGARLTRSDALRMAAFRGLDELEAENKKR